MLERKPEIVSLHGLLTSGCEVQLRFFGRFKAAWLVFTGRADAMTYPDFKESAS